MHGGARANAGRKPKLDAMQRIAIGSECERRMGAITDELVQQRLRRLLAEIEYDDAVAINREGLLRDGRSYTTSEDFRHAQEYLDEELQRVARETSPRIRVTGRRVSIPRARPQSVRGPIIAEVAAEWSEYLGKTISQSMVKKCWDECRAIEKRRRADSEDEPAS